MTRLIDDVTASMAGEDEEKGDGGIGNPDGEA